MSKQNTKNTNSDIIEELIKEEPKRKSPSLNKQHNHEIKEENENSAIDEEIPTDKVKQPKPQHNYKSETVPISIKASNPESLQKLLKEKSKLLKEK